MKKKVRIALSITFVNSDVERVLAFRERFKGITHREIYKEGMKLIKGR